MLRGILGRCGTQVDIHYAGDMFILSNEDDRTSARRPPHEEVRGIMSGILVGASMLS